VFTTSGSESGSLYLRTGSTNQLIFGIVGSGAPKTHTATCSWNKWHYIEFYPLGPGYRVWLYVDGQGYDLYCDGGLPNITSAKTLWIGRSSKNKCFQGYIDNLKIYNDWVRSESAGATYVRPT